MKRKTSILILILFTLAIVLLAVALTYNSKPQIEEPKQVSLLELKGSGVEIPRPVKDHQIIEHTGYVLSYNEEYEVADWVAYEFTKEELNTVVAKRKDNFREDKEVLTGSAQLDDYRKSGYSRGHLAPAADFKWSEEAMNDTFYLSNMTPQLQDNFNAGIWLKAEDFVREVCSRSEFVFVVTGPVLTDGPYDTIGSNNVAVPKQFYKALISILPDGTWNTFAMIIPQTASKNDDLALYMCSIDDVEKITKLDFFYKLEDTLEEKMESYRATSVKPF